MLDVIACAIALGALLWTMFRDNKNDSTELIERIFVLESEVSSHSTTLERLEKETGDLDVGLRNLEKQLHSVDVKIEKVITLLEHIKGKGA